MVGRVRYGFLPFANDAAIYEQFDAGDWRFVRERRR